MARLKLLKANMKPLQALHVKIYADGADKAGMLDLYKNPLIQGMTTNPTLMKKAGIRDYESFARDVLETVREKPISFEVFADEFPEMRRQALRMRDWQENVYVKIPISNPRGESSIPLIRSLAQDGVKLNVTAILTQRQIAEVTASLSPTAPSVVSIFAGRIADTGRDPVPMVRSARELLRHLPKAEILWASVREVFNIFQADESGAHIVTVPHDLLKKAIEMAGRDLDTLSLETVQMFDRDAKAAGYTLGGEVAETTATAPRALEVAA
jgi:transaldolase